MAPEDSARLIGDVCQGGDNGCGDVPGRVVCPEPSQHTEAFEAGFQDVEQDQCRSVGPDKRGHSGPVLGVRDVMAL